LLAIGLSLFFLSAADVACGMTRDEAAAIVSALAGTIEANYFDAESGKRIAADLRRMDLASAIAPVVLAGMLTDLLRRDDGHFAVTYVPAGATEREQSPFDYAALSRRQNFGFRAVEVLRGNVGYIDLREFAQVDDASAAAAAAAMGFTAAADAMIIDLRYNGGGDPAMVQLLSSYFFSEPVHLNTMIWRDGGEPRQFWTLPTVVGVRRPDVALYLLTSGRTGSAAEEFAYNLRALSRAVVIGEATFGAAHPGGVFDIAPGWQVFISTGRPVNPVTGGNWQDVGVQPHIAVQQSAAFDRAYALALQRLGEQSKDPQRLKEIAWAQAFDSARHVGAELVDPIPGNYGNRRIVTEDGLLRYVRNAGSPWTMLGPVDGWFYLAESDLRLRVDLQEPGSAKLIEQSISGTEQAFLRQSP
jgi:hypothetical protein